MSAPPPQTRRPIIPVGVEVADAGTRLIALVAAGSASRRIQQRSSLPVAPDEAHTALSDLALRLLKESGLASDDVSADISVCVVIPGRVERAAGTILQADGMPGWSHLALGQGLRQRFHHVAVESVTNAAALAESWAGAGTPYTSMLYVSLGRMVSSAYVLNGAVLRGAHERAGQLGHVRIATGGPRCACGALGHLDPVASAQSIVRNMIGLASGSEESHAAMLRVSHGRAEAMSAAHVFALAEAGDPAAESVISAALDGLSLAIGNIVAMLDPAVIVLDASSFADQTEALLRRLRERVHEVTATFADPVPILPSAYGAGGALEGARLIAERAGDG